MTDHGGSGPAVVLLHGGGRDSSDWDPVVARLRALGARPVTADLRGHGSTPAAPWTWDLALADVAGVVSGLSLDRPVVVGHSLGGMVATLWSGIADCPLAINLDGHGNPTSPAHYAGLADPLAGHVAVRTALDTMAAGLDEDFRGVLRAIDALDLFAAYRRARGPLVVTRGTHSMAGLLPEDAQEPWRAYERWTLAELRRTATEVPTFRLQETDTGHDVHLEDPDLVVSLLAPVLGG
ncbi:alpha/beta hydrolase [Amycolatopsis sp. NPDC048633]|uniref:alpha/beta fold hydrolase n=1 Tax=Amycolatopsis sp. NPDC048633 TaxID=3157095 RepID=UPI0033D5A70F